MCGISGYYSNKVKINLDKFYSGHLKLSHRGPDDEGFVACDNDGNMVLLKGKDTVTEFKNLKDILNFEDTLFIFGHRRLSIIDLSYMGHQPFVYDNLYLTYNGEIFNYLELREELELNGYIFETNSDTEVFLKAYHCWGIEAFKKFNGMWAAAIYNHDEKSIVLTRDRFGIKPLYYAIYNGALIFGSEIKFIAHFLDKLEAEEEAVNDFLKANLIDHNNKTFYKNIFQLEAGMYALCDSSINLNIYSYWDLIPDKIDKNTKQAIINAIKLRIRSDVPIGTLLSGGVNSSLITGILVKDFNMRLSTFSAIFDAEGKFDERDLIQTNVKQFNTDHHYIVPKISDFEKDLDDLIYTNEIPVRSFSVYAQYCIYRYIKNNTNIEVLLNGQGADEIFSGYSDHIYYYLASLVIKFDIIHFVKEYFFAINNGYNALSLFLRIIKIIIKHLYDFKYNKFNDIFLNKLYKDLSYSALKEYLHYDDRNSMRFSIETRVPFLDFNLVKHAFGLNSSEKICNSITKKKLREIGADYISKEILRNTKKMGFISPQEMWQKNDLAFLLDKAFNAISREGLFAFLDTQDILNRYDKYKDDIFKDWHYVWRVFVLYRWKKIWKIE